MIWQSGCDIWLISIGIRNVVELIEYQLVEIQRESLVQGEFLVIPLFLLSKGERDLCIYIVKFEKLRWPIWKEFWKSGWLSIDDIRVVANCGCQCMVIRVVANNSKGGDCCSQCEDWSLCCSCWHQYWSICELAQFELIDKVLRQFWDLKCWFDDEEPNFEKRYEKLISLMIWSLNVDLRYFPSLWISCGSVERVLKLFNLNFRFQQNFGFDSSWLKN